MSDTMLEVRSNVKGVVEHASKQKRSWAEQILRETDNRWTRRLLEGRKGVERPALGG